MIFFAPKDPNETKAQKKQDGNDKKRKGHIEHKKCANKR